MKNRYLLFLLCLSLSANSFAQKKETIQTKSKTTAVTNQQKKPSEVKKVEKPKVTMPAKKSQKKSTDKTHPTSASQKTSAADASLKSQTPKKSEASVDDSVHNNIPKKEVDTNPKNEKVIFPVQKDSENAAVNSDVKEKSVSSFNYLSLIPYLVIAILIVLLVRLYGQNERKTKSLERDLKQAKESNEYQVGNFKSQIKKLEGENKGLEDELESVKKELKIATKEKPKEIFENPMSSPPVFVEPTPPIKEESPIRFARYADQGDGFASSELLFEEDNDTIFEIRITSPKTATFKVANNLNAQKYALSNAGFFLGKTCKYDSTPSQNSTIATEMEGELKLQGSKWVILNPAKIVFT